MDGSDYANIFMSELDQKIAEIAQNNFPINPIKFFKRFLDDIIMVFRGTTKQLHSFIKDINKFTVLTD